MKYTLLENGVDSLKGAFNCLEKLPNLQEGIEHYLKDAILNLNHATEILFKLLLKNKEEYLVFNDLDKYMRAKVKVKKEGKRNVLEANPELKTVNLHEAIRRAELLCGINVPSGFRTAIDYVNDKRNQITHYELELTDEEVGNLIETLKACYELAVEFFEDTLGEIEDLLEEARFEVTWDDYYEYMAEQYGEMQYEDMKLAALEDWYEREL